jgi:hypothetical protein
LVDVAKLRLFSDTAKFSVLKKLNNRKFFFTRTTQISEGLHNNVSDITRWKNNPLVAEANPLKAINLTGIMSVTLPDGKKVP